MRQCFKKKTHLGTRTVYEWYQREKSGSNAEQDSPNWRSTIEGCATDVILQPGKFGRVAKKRKECPRSNVNVGITVPIIR